MTEITQADCDVTEYIAGDRVRDVDYQVVARHRSQAEQHVVDQIVSWLDDMIETAHKVKDTKAAYWFRRAKWGVKKEEWRK